MQLMAWSTTVMSPFNRHIDLGSKQLNVRRMMGFRLLIPSHSALPDLKSVLSILTGIEEFGLTSAKPFVTQARNVPQKPVRIQGRECSLHEQHL